jgi:hypothetical protein
VAFDLVTAIDSHTNGTISSGLKTSSFSLATQLILSSRTKAKAVPKQSKMLPH